MLILRHDYTDKNNIQNDFVFVFAKGTEGDQGEAGEPGPQGDRVCITLVMINTNVIIDPTFYFPSFSPLLSTTVLHSYSFPSSSNFSLPFFLMFLLAYFPFVHENKCFKLKALKGKYLH